MLQQETLRLFIAVEVSQQTKDAIHSLTEKLRVSDSHSSIRWVGYGDLHITLKFLGEVPQTNISSVEDAMKAAAADKRQFELSLSGTGVFPNGRSTGVFWIGVKDAGGSLIELANAVIRECANRGFPEENRPFAPHITIGRARDRADAQDLTKTANLLKSAGLRAESQIIDHISLIRSQLTPKGPIYTTLFTVPLR